MRGVLRRASIYYRLRRSVKLNYRDTVPEEHSRYEVRDIVQQWFYNFINILNL